MDLTHLRTFVAVAQEGHLTRAAERLHISQPAASSHVRALESFLDMRLFDRTNRGLELTAAGRALADAAARVLDASVALETLARELRGGVGGALDLGVNADPTLSRIGPIASWLRERHPRLEVNVQMRSSLATRQGVRAGELDAGFLLSATFDKGLSGIELTTLHYRIAGPAAWAERIAEADWKALAALPWIVTAPGTSNHEMRDDLFRPRRLAVNATVEVNNDLLLRTLIADGLGIGLVRADHAEQGERSGIYALSSLGGGETKLLFVYPESRAKDPVIQAVIDGVRQAWPASPATSSSRKQL
jgi:DNA-binding transcriptional LysR family regulator